jgi:hypothetical protein
MDEKCYQANPHGTLLEQIMNSSLPKTEREWAAKREIERLRLIAEAADMCMIELGALGEIDTEHPTVSALMNALHEWKPA